MHGIPEALTRVGFDAKARGWVASGARPGGRGCSEQRTESVVAMVAANTKDDGRDDLETTQRRPRDDPETSPDVLEKHVR